MKSATSRQDSPVTFAGVTQSAPERAGVRTEATRDHAKIQQWAKAHQALPATGEKTNSGPETVTLNDGSPAIRFNFPAASPFREISWEEWLAHFDAHSLSFVYEEQDHAQVSERAFAISTERGAGGDEATDWRQAELDLQREAGGEAPSGRYRLVGAPHD